MIERFDWRDAASRTAALARPRGRDDAALLTAVQAIVDDVRTRGWDAVVEQARRIDDAEPQLIAVAPYAKEARRLLPSDAQDAMKAPRRPAEARRRRLQKAQRRRCQRGMAIERVAFELRVEAALARPRVGARRGNA